jgi:hypothetical protein
MESKQAAALPVAALGRARRTAQAGPLTALLAQLVLLAALAWAVGLSGVGLSRAGWVVGAACGVITNAALARGLSRYRADRFSPADWVTLGRATLVVGIAALVADSFDRPAPVTVLVSLTALALALDAVDGWVARRTKTAATLGAHFDAEVDALVILILGVYVARSAARGCSRSARLATGGPLTHGPPVSALQPRPTRTARLTASAVQPSGASSTTRRSTEWRRLMRNLAADR